MLAMSVCLVCSAKGGYYISGMVRDAVTLEPLEFATVNATGQANGTLTNDKGIFELTVPDSTAELTIACLGYERYFLPISKKQINLYSVMMKPVATVLDEVVVRRQKYSKKNNPAVDFARKIKEMGPGTDPRRNAHYNYDKHQLTTFALNDFAGKDESSWMFRKFPFLWEHVDTSEISGKPILNLMVKEKTSSVHFRKEPKTEKEIVSGVRNEGIDEMFNQESMQVFAEDVLREIDLYDGDINILQNRFVSPLSKIAPDFYKFYLTDTVEIDNQKCIVLSFYPRNTASFGFNGQLFVPVNDSTMFIKKVTMRAPRNINLNFIENLVITQEFERAPDGSRLKTHDDLTMEARVMPGTPGLYVRRNVAYANHNFDAPGDPAIFDNLASEVTETGAATRTEDFWDANRILTVSNNEKTVGNMMDRLREVPAFRYTEQAMKILFTGYVTTGKKSKFDIGPVNTFMSFNPTEGTRLRFGGMTTANLSKRLFARGYGAYGFKDHKWKYGGELEYSFVDKNYHSREFPIHSIKLSSSYDLDQIGQHYLFTNQDNVFLSLKRMETNTSVYSFKNSVDYTLELHNNFSVTASVTRERLEATRHMPFTDGYGKNYTDYTENSLSVELRYAPGERYYQTKTYRIPVNLDAPVFSIRHTIAPQGWLGSTFMVNKTEIGFQKRFWLSAFGFVDAYVHGGHVWSRSVFPNLLIPNANLSYTIQPESYALMNPMEFVNDSYASVDITYWLNGALLNSIPLVKKLKLREVVNFKSLFGHLSDNNDPGLHPELFRFPEEAGVTRMTSRPYMEASAGIDNFFKCLRIDYVWRLSYLNVPYRIDRRGVRIAVHVTF